MPRSFLVKKHFSASKKPNYSELESQAGAWTGRGGMGRATHVGCSAGWCGAPVPGTRSPSVSARERVGDSLFAGMRGWGFIFFFNFMRFGRDGVRDPLCPGMGSRPPGTPGWAEEPGAPPWGGHGCAGRSP